MNAANVIHELRERGIALYIEDGALRAKASDSMLTDDVRQMIREHKAELLAFLPSEEADSPAPTREAPGNNVEPRPLPSHHGSISVDHAGEYHSQHPQTDRRFVTKLKRCPRCGGASWGPTGRYEADGAPLWGCTSCAT